MLQWEQAQLDAAVADIFGFHAVQLGLAEVQGLRANRMPHRWVLADTAARAEPLPLLQAADEAVDSQPLPAHPAALCDFDALPFPNNSLDLVVLTHTLELARDPHLTLHEVERVLVPEGRVIVTGFNPMSLWGLRQRLGRALHLAGRSQPYLPRAGEFLAYRRLRDWLRLLSFEVEGGRFGCWRPPYRSARWLERSAWVERVGERWWPVFGAVYFLVAVKRVRGMRLVGLARREARLTRPAGAIVANRRRQRVASGAE